MAKTNVGKQFASLFVKLTLWFTVAFLVIAALLFAAVYVKILLALMAFGVFMAALLRN